MKYILGLLLWAHLSMGQILKPKQEALIRNTIANQFGNEIANNCVLNLGRGSFCEVGGDTLYKLPGYHYVFKLQGDSALRLDKSMYHGIDHYSYIFNWENKLYCIGGYGMFLSHSTLKYFNVLTSEWTSVAVKGDCPAAINGICFVKDSILYSLNNFISGNNTIKDVKIPGLYKLNLHTMTWQHYDLNNEIETLLDNDFKMNVMFLNNFTIQKIFNHIILIDIRNLKLYNLPCDIIGLSYNEELISIDKDNLHTKTKNIDFGKKSLNDFLNYNFTSKPFKENKSSFYYLIIVLLFLIFGCLLIYYLIKKYHHKKPKLNEYEIFNNLENKTLTADELDVLLNIQHLEDDSRRLRRHRILNDFEKNKPGLIKRIKDPTDKRKFLYQIKNETKM